MEPIYDKELIKTKEFKKKGKKPHYPVYFPDKFLILNKPFYDKINELFSYEVFFLHPNKNNINEIRRIIEFRLCINYNHRLYSSNCFNPSDDYKITFISVCHLCHHIYILSGRYNTKKDYYKAFNFFKPPK